MKTINIEYGSDAFKQASEKRITFVSDLEGYVESFNANVNYVDGPDLENVSEAVDFVFDRFYMVYVKNGKGYTKDFTRVSGKFVRNALSSYYKEAENPQIVTRYQETAIRRLIDGFYYIISQKSDIIEIGIKMSDLITLKG